MAGCTVFWERIPGENKQEIIRLSSSVSIFGLGYVGSVSAACFASMGHKVIGVDVSRAKVEMLDSGRTPIIEARMSEMVAEANKACRLHATTDATEAVLSSDVSFVCVGTPSLKNGKLDLSHIENVAREIGGRSVRRKPRTSSFCAAPCCREQRRPSCSRFSKERAARNAGEILPSAITRSSCGRGARWPTS